MAAQLLRLAAAAAALSVGRSQPTHAACNSSRDMSTAAVVATCQDFCAGKCSFRNRTSSAPADQGAPLNLTLYRLTPQHVLGIANRNTGDPPGDVGFFLSRKTLAAECAQDPTNIRCFLNGINIYGKFEVEMDGLFGPYHMCNPTQGKDDTVDSNWKCYQYCEEPPKCEAWAKQNDTLDWQGPLCYCKNGRANHTVGRVHRESYHPGPPPSPPKWWPAEQCAAEGLVPSGGTRARCSLALLPTPPLRSRPDHRRARRLLHQRHRVQDPGGFNPSGVLCRVRQQRMRGVGYASRAGQRGGRRLPTDEITAEIPPCSPGRPLHRELQGAPPVRDTSAALMLLCMPPWCTPCSCICPLSVLTC